MSRASMKDGKVWYQREGDEQPIRISSGLLHVFLDGEEVMDAVAADEERGEVVIAVPGPASNRMVRDYQPDPLSPYGVKTETRRGRVEIRPEPTLSEILVGESPRGSWSEPA